MVASEYLRQRQLPFAPHWRRPDFQFCADEDVATILDISVDEVRALREHRVVRALSDNDVLVDDVLDLLGVRMPRVGDSPETYLRRCGRVGVTADAGYLFGLFTKTEEGRIAARGGGSPGAVVVD